MKLKRTVVSKHRFAKSDNDPLRCRWCGRPRGPHVGEPMQEAIAELRHTA